MSEGNRGENILTVNHGNEDSEEAVSVEDITATEESATGTRDIDSRLERNWIGITIAILGSIFVCVDIGSDVLIAKHYFNDLDLNGVYRDWICWSYHRHDRLRRECEPGYCSTIGQDNWDIFEKRDKSTPIPKECICFDSPDDTEGIPIFTGTCLWNKCHWECLWYVKQRNGSKCIKYYEEQYKRVILTPPPSPTFQMEEELGIFAYISIIWITLCGLIQTIRVLVIFWKDNESVGYLPVFFRLSLLISAPFLLSPVIVNVFIAYRCYKGISDVGLVKFKNIVASLKVGEVIVESIPQLITNAMSIFCQCGFLFGDRYLNLYSNISTVQKLSISTAVLGIAFTITTYISQQKNKYFISLNHHPWASSIGIFIWLIMFLPSTFFGVINLLSIEIDTLIIIVALLAVCVNLGLVIIIILTSIRASQCCKWLKRIISCIHILCVMTFTAYYLAYYGNVYKKRFIYAIAPWLLQLIFAIIILPFPQIGACIFDPFVTFMFKAMRVITCGKFKESIDKLQQWEHEAEDIDLTHEEVIRVRSPIEDTVPMEELEVNWNECEIETGVREVIIEKETVRDETIVNNQEETQDNVQGMINEEFQQE